MKVLTVKSKDPVPYEMQLDIHYAFRMEHHTDYILTDKAGPNYSSTISIEDTASVINTIVKNSSAFPDIAFLVDELDMDRDRIVRYHVKNGKIRMKRTGTMEWDEAEE